MILFYFYSILGFTNLYSISHYKNKYNQHLNITDYNYHIIFDFYTFFIYLLLTYNIVFHFINYNTINTGFIIFKLNYLIQFTILNFKFHKLFEFKTFENQNFTNLLTFSQIPIILLSSLFLYFNISFLQITDIISNIAEFIGLNIFYNSLLIFILIIIKIFQYVDKLRKDIKTIQDTNNQNIKEIYNQIIQYKYIISNKITSFNNILNFFTINNLITISLLYENFNSLNQYRFILFYILIAQFIFIEFICLGLILYISHIRNNILNELYSPVFINTYIKKNNLQNINYKYNLNINIDNLLVDDKLLLNRLEENGTSLDWIILYTSLNTKWVEFTLCGIKIHSIDSIAKIILYSSLFYKLFL